MYLGSVEISSDTIFYPCRPRGQPCCLKDKFLECCECHSHCIFVNIYHSRKFCWLLWMDHYHFLDLMMAKVSQSLMTGVRPVRALSHNYRIRYLLQIILFKLLHDSLMFVLLSTAVNCKFFVAMSNKTVEKKHFLLKDKSSIFMNKTI